jgi:hypothetical protein
MRNQARWTLALIGALVPSCADVWHSEYDDLAKIVGAGLATPDGGGDLGAIADTTMLARGIVPDGFTSDGLVAQGKRWGVTYRYTVMCSDEFAKPLARCDWRTDRALVLASRSGELAMPDFTARLRDQGTWNITSVGSPIAFVSGSVATMSQEVDFLDRTYFVTDTGELKAFVDMARQDMMGGTIARRLEVERYDDDGDWWRSFTIAAEVTILSPGTASLALDVDHLYEVDLATGEVTEP